MPRTFTLPRELHNRTAALSEADLCDLVIQSETLDLLVEEFSDMQFSPSQQSVDKVLAYSKAVEIKRSATLVGDHHLIVMN